MNVVVAIAAVVVPAMLAGCARIGPATMPEDRLAYTVAVAKSLEEQLLLNIVRTRYAEAPTFVDVSQIVAGYEFVREGSLSSEYHPQGSPDSFVGLGAALRLTEKPTISYAPLSGEAFSRALVVPVPPHMVLLLIQAGWGADGVLNLCARSINGYHNRLPRVGGAIEPGVLSHRFAVAPGAGCRRRGFPGARRRRQETVDLPDCARVTELGSRDAIGRAAANPAHR